MSNNPKIFTIALMTLLVTFTVLANQTLAEDCNKIKDLDARKSCWVERAKSGEKDLHSAYLNKADLSGIDLSGANLTNADLTRANLQKADLSKAKLNGAHIDQAFLNGADLTGADLTRASVQASDLTDSVLTDTIVMKAKINSYTKGIDMADWKNRGAEDVTASVD